MEEMIYNIKKGIQTKKKPKETFSLIKIILNYFSENNIFFNNKKNNY